MDYQIPVLEKKKIQREDWKKPLQFCQEMVNICFARIIGKVAK